MASDGKEIEIKISLTDSEFSMVRKRVQEKATFVKESLQEEEYFNPPHRNFVNREPISEWLSIRKRGSSSLLNYKQFHPKDAEVFTYCDEVETKIVDPKKLRELFSALDFKPLVTVKKKRETYTYNDEFEIALDSVEELGHFIEIEALKHLATEKATRDHCIEFARSLGIQFKEADKRGYPNLLMRKRGLL